MRRSCMAGKNVRAPRVMDDRERGALVFLPGGIWGRKTHAAARAFFFRGLDSARSPVVWWG